MENKTKEKQEKILSNEIKIEETQINANIETQPKLTKKQEWWNVLKFVLISISAGIIQMLSFTLMNELIGWTYWPSYLISLTLSVVWNFTINRKYTFKSANNVPIAMLLVLVYYAVFTPLSTWWGDALTKINWNEYIVLFGTMVINMATEFLWDRFVVFRKSINTNKIAKKDNKKEGK